MEENKEKETRLKKIKRMLAFTGIILLLGLYAATLITSFILKNLYIFNKVHFDIVFHN